MAIPVLMPRQGQSVETCILGEWVKKKGDAVKVGDILFSYETDKASFEEDAKADGILLDVFFAEGDEVPVLVNVAVIGAAGESVDEFRPGGQAAAPVAETVAAVEVVTEKLAALEVKTVAEPLGKVKISPRAKNLAEKSGVAYQQLQGSGPEGRIIERDIEAAAQALPKLTPLAQEKAKAEGLKAGEAATGLGGKAVAKDLISYNPVYSDDFEVKKLTNMRKLIAKAMYTSLQNSAQLTHHMSADARTIMALRKKFKKALDA
ncbi:MAG: E3 binding domain-containing protein, partial [Bacteroidota bacterium]|nr:E3 binding domain-containing protein [Bacteroidota bacterium]